MMSQIEKNNFVVQTSLSLQFLKRGKNKNEISPFGVDFEICNFVDSFVSKHTPYSQTKIQKVKKHNRTPFKDSSL